MIFFTKNVHIGVTFCVDSKSAIRNIIAPRNREIIAKTCFRYLLAQEVFLHQQEERYDQTNFKNEIYTYKRTSTYISGMCQGIVRQKNPVFGVFEPEMGKSTS